MFGTTYISPRFVNLLLLTLSINLNRNVISKCITRRYFKKKKNVSFQQHTRTNAKNIQRLFNLITPRGAVTRIRGGGGREGGVQRGSCCFIAMPAAELAETTFRHVCSNLLAGNFQRVKLERVQRRKQWRMDCRNCKLRHVFCQERVSCNVTSRRFLRGHKEGRKLRVMTV